MRIRTIKPSFFKDEEIADLDPLCRLLFQGLWLMADSEGRLEDRPKRIKVEVLPYDECNIDAMLDDLVAARCIIRYEAGGKSCIQVRNFLKHQRIQTKEAIIKSEIPPDSSQYEPGTQPVRIEYEPGTQPESQEGKGKEGKGKEREGAHAENLDSPSLNVQAEHTWSTFKQLMPLRNGKFLDEDACREKWARSPAKWNQWIAAVRNYRKSNEVRDGAVCSPMTFIARKWRDWEQPEKEQSVPLGQAPQHGPHDTSWLEQVKRDEEIARKSTHRTPRSREGLRHERLD